MTLPLILLLLLLMLLLLLLDDIDEFCGSITGGLLFGGDRCNVDWLAPKNRKDEIGINFIGIHKGALFVSLTTAIIKDTITTLKDV